MDKQCDFSGWATRANLKCSDGRTIAKGAFAADNGRKVPLVWNHIHNDPLDILGHAILESREDGVYAYCFLNDTSAGQAVREAVKHGDIQSLSIYANKLKQQNGLVTHGVIRELSVVMAGANPGAYIDTVMAHGEDSDEEAIIYTGEGLVSSEESVSHAEPEEKPQEKSEPESGEGETVQDVLNTLNEKQKKVVSYIVGEALGQSDDDDDMEHSEGGDTSMKYNVFDKEETTDTVLSHADQATIINLAKQTSVGSLRAAMEIFMEENKDTLAHGIDEIELLFPDFKDVHPGAPELIERDQSWVSAVMSKARKSPVSRVRTRQADARANELRAKGYNNRNEEKRLSGNIKLLMRKTEPQTVYRRDELHRDDIIDITDFDVVAYQHTVMRHNMEEEIALAALVGDGRDETDPDKIHEENIRSIWHDADLYTIHADVDIAAARRELQGSNTSANFGENYIYAEAIITAALYSREKYKGKGQPDLFCTPHLLNVMLLARDLNGRRIYDSASDLAKALNVGTIHTVEQMQGLTRTDGGKTKKLLGIFVNMSNYQFGCTKGGEITNFEDFDIDFNKYKYLMETRLSGALTEIYSAIALEEPVAAASEPAAG